MTIIKYLRSHNMLFYWSCNICSADVGNENSSHGRLTKKFSHSLNLPCYYRLRSSTAFTFSNWVDWWGIYRITLWLVGSSSLSGASASLHHRHDSAPHLLELWDAEAEQKRIGGTTSETQNEVGAARMAIFISHLLWRVHAQVELFLYGCETQWVGMFLLFERILQCGGSIYPLLMCPSWSLCAQPRYFGRLLLCGAFDLCLCALGSYPFGYLATQLLRLNPLWAHTDLCPIWQGCHLCAPR